MFGKSKPEVLIVGAGPVGLLAALQLTRRGIPLRIVDEAQRTARHSYALALHGASLELLDRVGLLERVLADSVRVNTVAFYEGAERMAELSLLDLGESNGFVAVTRQDRLEGLLENTLKEAGVSVQWNHRAARFVPQDKGVLVSIDRLEKDSVGYAVSRTEWVVASTRDVPFRYVIGADGHNSLARRQSEIRFDAVAPAEQFAVFEFDLDRDPPQELVVVLDANTTDVLWPLPNRRCRFSFQIGDEPLNAGTRTKDRFSIDLGAMRFPVLDEALLGRLIDQRAPWFEGVPGEIHWRMAVRFERRLAERFGAGRLWLAGDAGHMTGPVAAQSMNVGLREALDLADILTGQLRVGEEPERLQAYGKHRHDEWQRLLGIHSPVVASARASDWIRARADRLVSCVPASGDVLDVALDRLGLHWAERS